MQTTGICFNYHFIFRRRRTGSNNTSSLIFYHTHTAGTINGHIRIVTKSRYMNPYFMNDLQNIFFIRKLGTNAINYHIFFLSHCYTSFTAPKLHPSLHAPHLIHFVVSITCGSFTFPEIAPTGHILAHLVQPLQSSGSI